MRSGWVLQECSAEDATSMRCYFVCMKARSGGIAVSSKVSGAMKALKVQLFELIVQKL